MKKLLTTLLSITIALVPLHVAQANDQKVLAIIDTTIDSNKIPSVIYEACFAQSGSDTSCPNGSGFMEGKGSANLQRVPASGSVSNFNHGTTMTQTALLTSPEIKIVFVRIAHITPNGSMGVSNPESISRAVEWVSKNASKYSIDAVSISQSFTTATHLLRCTNDTTIINAVSSLNNQSVPVFASTGNDRLTDKVGFPSCVSGVIGVGALAWSKNTKLPADYTVMNPVTNRGPGLDVVAQGEQQIGSVQYTGTSIASAIAASLYVNKNTDRNVNNFIGTFSKVLTYPYISK
ncbi:MAG: hypothetical protein EB127_04915 [Alphaproteobacteria bacterium]|nr:hypothetical protein [Alphaproteobacteria bacterium]